MSDIEPLLGILESRPKVTLIMFPAWAGTMSGAGTYDRGQPVTIQATLTAAQPHGLVWRGWYEMGRLVTSNLSYSFIVYHTRSFAAVFDTVGQAPIPFPGWTIPTPPPPPSLVTPTGPVTPTGLSTGTLIALGVGVVAVIGGVLWLILRREQ